MPIGNQAPSQMPPELDRLERKENEVWRLAILMLVILAVGVAVLSHQALQSSQWHLEALPVGAGFSSSCSRSLRMEQKTRDRRTTRVCPGDSRRSRIPHPVLNNSKGLPKSSPLPVKDDTAT